MKKPICFVWILGGLLIGLPNIAFSAGNGNNSRAPECTHVSEDKRTAIGVGVGMIACAPSGHPGAIIGCGMVGALVAKDGYKKAQPDCEMVCAKPHYLSPRGIDLEDYPLRLPGRIAETIERQFDLIGFETAKHELNEHHKTRLGHELALVSQCCSRIDVVGYADGRGGASNNVELSRRRAESVIDFIRATPAVKGRASLDIYMAAGGETGEDADMPRNRRVTVTVLCNKKVQLACKNCTDATK